MHHIDGRGNEKSNSSYRILDHDDVSRQVLPQPRRSNSRQVPSIGKPIHFVGGQFTGRTIRAELREIQQASVGRKYATIDRRPIDPPPVVLLKLFTIYNVGTDRETEEEFEHYDDVQAHGMLCSVDLFPVPDSGGPWTQQPIPSNHIPYTSSTTHSSLRSIYTPEPWSSVNPAHTPRFLPPNALAPDIVWHHNNFAITESSKLTSSLVGATFVEPSVIDYQGKKALLFVFADLAVKMEGTFILRFRVFDILSQIDGNSDCAIQAECYGGEFRVYSTKDFPGLPVSTELTKQLGRWGVRVNIRETERKRRKNPGAENMDQAGEAVRNSEDLSDP